MGLPMIVNEKTVDPGDKSTPAVYQLETAMGAAVGVFEGAGALRVPRSRFVPVKKTTDLLVLRSDAYELGDGARVVLAPGRSVAAARRPGRRPLQAPARLRRALPATARRRCGRRRAAGGAGRRDVRPRRGRARAVAVEGPRRSRTGRCWRAERRPPAAVGRTVARRVGRALRPERGRPMSALTSCWCSWGWCSWWSRRTYRPTARSARPGIAALARRARRCSWWRRAGACLLALAVGMPGGGRGRRAEPSWRRARAAPPGGARRAAARKGSSGASASCGGRSSRCGPGRRGRRALARAPVVGRRGRAAARCRATRWSSTTCRASRLSVRRAEAWEVDP